MPTPRIIGHAASDTPADLQTTPGRPRRLPDDLLRQASRRLQILALLAAALWFLGPALGHLAIYISSPHDSTADQFRVLDGIAAFAFANSIGLYFYLRRTRRDPGFVLDLGLAYLVLTAVELGVMIHWGPATAMPLNVRPMITWIGPVHPDDGRHRPGGSAEDARRPDSSPRRWTRSGCCSRARAASTSSTRCSTRSPCTTPTT